MVTALRSERDPGTWRIHRDTLRRLEGNRLVVIASSDEEVPEGAVDVPPDLCGAQLVFG